MSVFRLNPLPSQYLRCKPKTFSVTVTSIYILLLARVAIHTFIKKKTPAKPSSERLGFPESFPSEIRNQYFRSMPLTYAPKVLSPRGENECLASGKTEGPLKHLGPPWTELINPFVFFRESRRYQGTISMQFLTITTRYGEDIYHVCNGVRG